MQKYCPLFGVVYYSSVSFYCNKIELFLSINVQKMPSLHSAVLLRYVVCPSVTLVDCDHMH